MMSHDAASSSQIQIRQRLLDLADDYARDDTSYPSVGETLVAQTATKTTYPTAAAVFYYMLPSVVLGAETEGGAATLTSAVTAASFFALNLGSAIPPSGTQLAVSFVGNRWVFRYDG